MGVVGSGKTTELFAIQQRLNQLDDTRAFYVDVSKGHDIQALVPGAIVFQAALALGRGFVASAAGSSEDRRGASATIERLSAIAEGYRPDSNEYPGDGGRGVVRRPDPLDAQWVEAAETLRRLLRPIRNRWPHLVVLLDGLDRLTNLSTVEKAIRSDLTWLRDLGIGTVLVGPLSAVYGNHRASLGHFASTQSHPWIDTTRGSNGTMLLSAALLRRLPRDVLDDAALETLVRNSGGVFRDLMSLARSACVEAYMTGSDIISKAHADAAVDAFGRKHMQGISSTELEALQRVRASAAFVQSAEVALPLLMSRRVLEYVGPKEERRYVVHPTIVPFLRQLAR